MTAQVATNLNTEFSLSHLVREELDGNEADPHVIAELVISRLTLPECRLALYETLHQFVRETIRRDRNRPTSGQGMSVSDRWDNVATLQASGDLSLLRSRVFANGAWKFLGDCTRNDVENIAEQREEEAALNTAMAERYRKLRAAMGRRRAQTVSDLPGEIIREIFDA